MTMTDRSGTAAEAGMHDLDAAADEILGQAKEAGAPTEGRTGTLEGMAADTKMSVINMSVDVTETFALGERVELRVIGTIVHVGDDLLENEGRRHGVKLKATLIQVVGTPEETVAEPDALDLD